MYKSSEIIDLCTYIFIFFRQLERAERKTTSASKRTTELIPPPREKSPRLLEDMDSLNQGTVITMERAQDEIDMFGELIKTTLRNIPSKAVRSQTKLKICQLLFEAECESDDNSHIVITQKRKRTDDDFE